MKNIIISLLSIIGSVHYAYTQRLDDMTEYPATPQTTALFKTIAAPVSHYTGQPNISIPLYTISQDGADVPVSISFNSSGIYVTEESTPIGLGVSLDWGGSIVRTPNGSPDEKAFFTDNYIIDDLKEDLPKNYTNTSSMICYPYCDDQTSMNRLDERFDIYYNANKFNDPYIINNFTQHTDFQPDDFHYNVLGKSGLFKFNQLEGKFITYPLDDIAIQKHVSSKILTKFDITLSNGVKVTLGDGAVDRISKSNISPTLSQSWFIKSITTTKNSIINFDYIGNRYWNNSTSPSEMWIPYPYQGPPAGGVSSADLLEEKLIKSISFEQGKLDFVYVRDRIDINPTDGYSSTNANQPSPRMDKIVLMDSKNNVIKTFQFHQSYFSANSGAGNVYDKRLRLDSLSMLDNASNRIERYKFEYHTLSSYPSKASKARDHWGYYNGAIYNTSLIPSSLVPTGHSETQHGTSWSGYDNWHDYYMNTLKGNRFINSNYNKVFTIKKIKFPTGGEREYVFEDHQIPYYDLMSQMKDISNDGYDLVHQRFTIQGQSLLSSNPAPATTNWNNTERIVYTDEFTIDGTVDTVLNEPNIYMRTDYVKPSISPNQLNMWQYSITVSLEKKDGNSFVPAGFGSTTNRTDASFSSTPFPKLEMRKIQPLSSGTYRFSVRMVSPPPNVVNGWGYNGHFTVIGLTFRKLNFENIKVGGLRVAEIIDRDRTTEYRTTYDYTTDGSFSSGRIVNFPEYKERIITSEQTLLPNQEGQYYKNYVGLRISQNPVSPIVRTEGSNVGYTKVTKKVLGGSAVIKEEFVYEFKPNIFSGYLRQYHQETEPRLWHRGKLLSHKKFEGLNVVSEDIYDYYGRDNETDKGFVEEINTGLITGPIYAQADYTQAIWDISIDRRTTNPFWFSGADFYPNLYYFDNRSDIVNGTINNFYVAHISPIQKIPYFKMHTGFDKIKSKKTINTTSNGTVTQTEKYYYDAVPAHLGMTRKETSSSLNETLATRFYYPHDLATEPMMSAMITAHRIGNPVKSEQFFNGTKTSEEKFTFTNDATTGGMLMPKNIYSAKFPNAFPSLPDVGQLEKKITYDKYDSGGNLVQYTTEGGIPTSIIWGYGKTMPVAKLENVDYESIAANVITDIQSKSDLDNDRCQLPTCKEEQLRTVLNNLRTTFPSAMITTYTYDPLVGVTSITDPKGDKVTYEYDSFSRLQFVKDRDGNILGENQYHYRPQN